MGPDGVVLHSDAFPPETLVDTLGAGDTFNAAVIYKLSRGDNILLSSTFNTYRLVSAAVCGEALQGDIGVGHKNWTNHLGHHLGFSEYSHALTPPTPG